MSWRRRSIGGVTLVQLVGPTSAMKQQPQVPREEYAWVAKAGGPIGVTPGDTVLLWGEEWIADPIPFLCWRAPAARAASLGLVSLTYCLMPELSYRGVRLEITSQLPSLSEGPTYANLILSAQSIDEAGAKMKKVDLSPEAWMGFLWYEDNEGDFPGKVTLVNGEELRISQHPDVMDDGRVWHWSLAHAPARPLFSLVTDTQPCLTGRALTAEAAVEEALDAPNRLLQIALAIVRDSFNASGERGVH